MQTLIYYATQTAGLAWSAVTYIHGTTAAYVAYHAVLFCATALACMISATVIPRQEYRLKMFHMQAVCRRVELAAQGFFDKDNLQRGTLEYPGTSELLAPEIDKAMKFVGRYLLCLYWMAFVCTVCQLLLPMIGMLPLIGVFACSLSIVIISLDIVEIGWYDFVVINNAAGNYNFPRSMIHNQTHHASNMFFGLIFLVPLIVIMHVYSSLGAWMIRYLLNLN